MSDMDELLEGMLRKLFGNKIPKAEFERMLPELKEMMLNTMPDFSDEEEEYDDDDDDDDDDDELDLDFLFRKSPPTSKKRKGRTRGGFQELF
jgi:hypothetical protein